MVIQRIGLRCLLVGYASLALACSSSSPAATTAGDDSGQTSDAGGGEPDSTTPPPSDSGNMTPPADTGTGGETGAALDCTSYCSAIQAACTGANQQYADNTSCMNACMNIPVGTAADTSGNTLGCRVYHTMLATSMPVPHCWHAGPFGYGGCGDECDSFCTLATTWCTPADGFDGGAPPYASKSDCLTACAGFAMIDAADGGIGVDGGFNATGPSAGNTLDCREYHLSASFAGGAMQQLHCQHPGASSPVCM